MQKNYLKQILITISAVIAILCVLSFIPEFTIGTFTFKPINILSDVRPLPTEKKDTTATATQTPKGNTSCKAGIVCITDFSEDKNAFFPFVKALTTIKKTGKSARIAFFGDSFVEGDMILAQLRDTLQQLYGGHGVGYVPLTSPVARLRPTIEHDYKGWKTYAIIEKKDNIRFGIGGNTFVPETGAFVEYRIPSLYRIATLQRFSKVKIYYEAKNPVSFQYAFDKNAPQTAQLAATDKVNVQTLQQVNATKIRATFPNVGESLHIYGMSIEDEPGVYIDNFSLRGNAGQSLLRIDSEMFKDINAIQQYDLVVLEYGLNVSRGTDVGLVQYAKEMDSTVSYIRKQFPTTPILLVGISDRGEKIDGEYKTAKQIRFLLDMQDKLIRKHKLLHWNTFEAMGGENSMAHWVEKNWAQKDYTHLKFAGGGEMARRLAAAILYEVEKNKATVEN